MFPFSFVLQVLEEMHALLGSFGQGAGFGCPGEVFHGVNAKELGAHHSLYCGAIYAQGAYSTQDFLKSTTIYFNLLTFRDSFCSCTRL